VWESLHPTDIDLATVGDIMRFIKKSQILVKYPVTLGISRDSRWTHTVSKSMGRWNAFPLLEPGTCQTATILNKKLCRCRGRNRMWKNFDCKMWAICISWKGMLNVNKNCTSYLHLYFAL